MKKMENYYFEDGKLKCIHTKEKCVINDTVAGSSCCGCGHNPNNMFSHQNIIIKVE